MQPPDGSPRFDPLGGAGGRGGGTGEPGGEPGGEPEGDGGEGRPTSIRDRQRRRRNAGRSRPDLTAVLGRPEGEEDVDEAEEDVDEPAPGPPPARVFVVFRGASWEDPEGGLRESDSIVAVYATEEAARRAVAQLRREGGETAESWFQPYAVQE